MRVVDQLAVGAADALEKAAGPKAALVAWRKLATQGLGLDARARAGARAMTCAVAVSDLPALREVIALWPSLTEGAYFGDVASLCKKLARAGELRLAADLAGAEAKRARSARALYLQARTLELAADPACAEAAAEAATRANAEGDAALAARARLRRAAWLARNRRTLVAALAEASLVDGSQLDARGQIVLADVLLRSPSRFARAGAIDLLDRAAAAGDADVSRTAMTRLLAFADDARHWLTPLELDRLRASILRNLPARAAGLLALLDAASPARDADAEAEAPRRIGSALEAGRYADALDEIVRAKANVELSGRAPGGLWAAVELALDSPHASLSAAALSLGQALLERTSTVPPRGLLAFARAVEAAGADDLAETCARGAIALREPGASAALGEILRRRGWRLATTGSRRHAIEALREAKSLLA